MPKQICGGKGRARCARGWADCGAGAWGGGEERWIKVAGKNMRQQASIDRSWAFIISSALMGEAFQTLGRG
jgi:hypothetical protein